MPNCAPIVVFCYNRPSHLKTLIESIQLNKEAIDSDLYVFSDGAKNELDIPLVQEIRKYISSLMGFKSIHCIWRENNIGLAKNVISGVSEVFVKYEKIIVLEDDLCVSENFLDYMNQSLAYYKDQPSIFSISGYTAPIEIPSNYQPDVFLFYRINSWGWGTWRDRWEKMDWEIADFEIFIRNNQLRKAFNRGGEDCTPMLLRQMQGKINSWAIRFNYNCYKKSLLNIYPVISKVSNTGNDGSGTHVKSTSYYNTSLDIEQKAVQLMMPELDSQIVSNYQHFFKKSFLRKIIYSFNLYQYLIFNRFKS